MQASTQYHTEQSMTQRRANNPDDEQAREYFDKQTKKRNAQEQYQHMTSEYPEALGRVLMLYVSAKINGHDVQPFVDSGAQSTIISLKLARACGLENYIDERFAGTAVGVGTGTILGRIHMVQLQIETMFFPCSVSVMDDSLGGSEMPFLLGLDMLKRHTCQIDLEQGCLKFRVAPGQYMVTPFLHEKDLDETKGGTKGFNADESNKKLAAAIEKAEKDGDRDDGNDDMDTLS
jgi:DNA damage-inducible protein 1